MPNYLQWLSAALPLTYAVDGLRGIMLTGKSLLDVSFELAILVGFAAITSLLAAITMRRSTSG
jgi:ABC-2 type transport system permease protein